MPSSAVQETPQMRGFLYLGVQRTRRNLSLAEAKMLLEDLGPLAGAAAGLIERRISELEEAARRAAGTIQRMELFPRIITPAYPG